LYADENPIPTSASKCDSPSKYLGKRVFFGAGDRQIMEDRRASKPSSGRLSVSRKQPRQIKLCKSRGFHVKKLCKLRGFHAIAQYTLPDYNKRHIYKKTPPEKISGGASHLHRIMI